MKIKIVLILAVLVVGILLTINSNTEARNDDCTEMTDDQIISSIYGYIEKKYNDHMDHVNVRINDGVVTLEGWSAGKKKGEKIQKFASKVKCVKSVDNKLAESKTGGCGPGTKRCGTICIPEAETCNISTKGG